ncbi:MAG: hypothetical protein JXR96_21070 [Deltaproteobacteria bacterium]|nr:hypothetical protein [Deltaproteobacteria bacterium]
MSWSISVGGRVAFPSDKAVREWLDSEFREDAHDDWDDMFGLDGKGRWRCKDYLGNTDWDDDVYIHCALEGKVLRLRAELPEDFANENLRAVAAFVRSAAPFGAEGILEACVPGEDAECLTLADGDSQVGPSETESWEVFEQEHFDDL